MLTIGIRYLNGWSMAAVNNAEKRQAEWPPHPDRIFMAMAAAWFQTGEDVAEGDALRWLERLPPPEIAASDCSARTITDSYVPVNDMKVGKKVPSEADLKKLKEKKKEKGLAVIPEHLVKYLKEKGLAVIPEYRIRKERRFPVAVPYDPEVYMVWPNADPKPYRTPLEQLVIKVTHVGHSASFAQLWVDDKEHQTNWKPTDGIAYTSMRVPTPGRLELLSKCYNQSTMLEYDNMKARVDALHGPKKKRLKYMMSERFPQPPMSMRPPSGAWRRYSLRQDSSISDAAHTIFDQNIVVMTVRGRVSLNATLMLTRALRGALMRYCPVQPPPEWLSGHQDSGAPTTKPHMALFPLPFADSEHADGHVMGVALALPRGLDKDEAGRILSPFLYDSSGQPRVHRLFDSRHMECIISLETREHPPWNLAANTWTRKSHIWASVTPVALDRHFDGRNKWELAAEDMKDSCERIGLPRPASALLHPVSHVAAIPSSNVFPPLPIKGGGSRRHRHAVITFDQPVTGPVLVGAGRYRGYGLFRPVYDG